MCHGTAVTMLVADISLNVYRMLIVYFTLFGLINGMDNMQIRQLLYYLMVLQLWHLFTCSTPSSSLSAMPIHAWRMR